MFQLAEIHKKLAWALIILSSITIIIVHNMQDGYKRKFRPATHNSNIPYQEELILNFDRNSIPLERLLETSSIQQSFSVSYQDTKYAKLLVSKKDSFVYLIWEWESLDPEDHFTDTSLAFSNGQVPTKELAKQTEGIFLGSLFSKPEAGIRFVLYKIAEETWKTYTKGKFFVYREFDGHIIWVSKETKLSQNQ